MKQAEKIALVDKISANSTTVNSSNNNKSLYSFDKIINSINNDTFIIKDDSIRIYKKDNNELLNDTDNQKKLRNKLRKSLKTIINNINLSVKNKDLKQFKATYKTLINFHKSYMLSDNFAVDTITQSKITQSLLIDIFNLYELINSDDKFTF